MKMAAKQVSVTEAELIQWFSSQVQSLQYNKNIEVENLTLSYNKTDGYSILLQPVVASGDSE